MGPGDFFRDRMSNLRAHPFQNIASTVAGGLIPGGGFAANALFGRYNDSRFNNSAQQFQDFTSDQSNLDTNDAMNKPLSGPLGDYDRANPLGEQPNSGSTGDRASQDRQLGEALSGSGGGANAGGPMGGVGYQPIGGWNQQTMSGFNPNQANASQNFGLLDFLGPNPNQTTQTMGSSVGPAPGHLNGPAARRDGYGGGGFALNGVSNFMVGGSPVINGVNPGLGADMNGLAMYNPRRYGG